MADYKPVKYKLERLPALSTLERRGSTADERRNVGLQSDYNTAAGIVFDSVAPNATRIIRPAVFIEPKKDEGVEETEQEIEEMDKKVEDNHLVIVVPEGIRTDEAVSMMGRGIGKSIAHLSKEETAGLRNSGVRKWMLDQSVEINGTSLVAKGFPGMQHAFESASGNDEAGDPFVQIMQIEEYIAEQADERTLTPETLVRATYAVAALASGSSKMIRDQRLGDGNNITVTSNIITAGISGTVLSKNRSADSNNVRVNSVGASVAVAVLARATHGLNTEIVRMRSNILQQQKDRARTLPSLTLVSPDLDIIGGPSASNGMYGLTNSDGTPMRDNEQARRLVSTWAVDPSTLGSKFSKDVTHCIFEPNSVIGRVAASIDSVAMAKRQTLPSAINHANSISKFIQFEEDPPGDGDGDGDPDGGDGDNSGEAGGGDGTEGEEGAGEGGQGNGQGEAQDGEGSSGGGGDQPDQPDQQDKSNKPDKPKEKKKDPEKNKDESDKKDDSDDKDGGDQGGNGYSLDDKNLDDHKGTVIDMAWKNHAKRSAKILTDDIGDAILEAIKKETSWWDMEKMGDASKEEVVNQVTEQDPDRFVVDEAKNLSRSMNARFATRGSTDIVAPGRFDRMAEARGEIVPFRMEIGGNEKPAPGAVICLDVSGSMYSSVSGYSANNHKGQRMQKIDAAVLAAQVVTLSIEANNGNVVGMVFGTRAGADLKRIDKAAKAPASASKKDRNQTADLLFFDSTSGSGYGRSFGNGIGGGTSFKFLTSVWKDYPNHQVILITDGEGDMPGMCLPKDKARTSAIVIPSGDPRAMEKIAETVITLNDLNQLTNILGMLIPRGEVA